MEKDKDLLAGRKEILAFLDVARWSAVMKRRKMGMPMTKVCGRWEMSIEGYRQWKKCLLKTDQEKNLVL